MRYKDGGGKIIYENDGDIYGKMEVYPASTRPPQ
jgi:hypothetical protein